MTSLMRWQTANQEYLGAALQWLRLRLEQASADVASAPSTAEASPSPERADTDGAVAAARAAMAQAGAADPPPAAVIVRERLGLSAFELDVLLLCAAMELDSRVAGMCARAQPESNRPFPTFALALTLFADAAWDALSPERPLRRWRLIEINQPYAQPLTTSALRADERIVSYLKGLNYLDDRLTPLVFPVLPADGLTALRASQQTVVDSILVCLQRGAEMQSLPVIQLVGADPVSKQLIASHVASALSLDLFRLPVDLLPAQAGELETLARLWQRESVLLPIALYLDTVEVDRPHEASGPVLDRFLARSTGIVFLDSREARPCPTRAAQIYDVAKPTSQEQRMAWSDQLGTTSNGLAGKLAEQFDLNLGTIHRISQSVRLGNDDRDDSTRVWDACLAHTRPRLNMLAQRLDPKATWDDLVLPESEIRLLKQITAQAGQRAKVYDQWGFRRRMSRGLGITALFAGPSGTGKTMAAEVLASGLRLNLYRIDLSAVVSKYIGETEKNLGRLFDAGEDGGAILFFDEADALFGKRSEVRDSHDRYANIEINYLLQRMEAFRGLAILATNMKSALDQAFMRRLRFIVNFPFPGLPERRAIWERVFPSETETSGLDFERLAAFALTGGSIHSVALNAAFLAAQARQPVTMSVVFEAVRSELRKLEQPIHEADFRYSGPAVAPMPTP
jgi:ATP-dependent 26S proteasome regulatory subunit